MKDPRNMHCHKNINQYFSQKYIYIYIYILLNVVHCCKFSIYLSWAEIVKISTIPSVECEEEYIKIKNRIKNFIDKFINEIQSSIPNPKFQRERERD